MNIKIGLKKLLKKKDYKYDYQKIKLNMSNTKK